jgi:hypothetical protein
MYLSSEIYFSGAFTGSRTQTPIQKKEVKISLGDNDTSCTELHPLINRRILFDM